MEPIYDIDDNAKYKTEIRALQNTNPALASETFNPLFETMLNNTHAVKKEAEGIGAKVKWIEYISLSQIGLTNEMIAESGTLATIVEAMPDYSTLTISISAADSWISLFPFTAGLFSVKKHTLSRAYLYFETSNTTMAGLKKYYAQYRNDGTSGFVNNISEWKAVVTANQMEDFVPKIQQGITVVPNPEVGKVNVVYIEFSQEFKTRPRIFLTPNTAVPHQVSVSAREITFKGFNMYLVRTTNTDVTNVDWMAIQS